MFNENIRQGSEWQTSELIIVRKWAYENDIFLTKQREKEVMPFKIAHSMRINMEKCSNRQYAASSDCYTGNFKWFFPPRVGISADIDADVIIIVI